MTDQKKGEERINVRHGVTVEGGALVNEVSRYMTDQKKSEDKNTTGAADAGVREKYRIDPRRVTAEGQTEKSLDEKYQDLQDYLKSLGRVAVAFSGGVDSTLLLKVAHDVLGDNCVAVTAKSKSFPERELNESNDFCLEEGIKHYYTDSEELDLPGFRQNPTNRCYLCKHELFEEIEKMAGEIFPELGVNEEEVGKSDSQDDSAEVDRLGKSDSQDDSAEVDRLGKDDSQDDSAEVDNLGKDDSQDDSAEVDNLGKSDSQDDSAEVDNLGKVYICEGSNMDDNGDFRPGLKAIEELGVTSPLRHAGLYKEEIRELSKRLGLKTYRKQSFACLSSRFVYGETISDQKLRMVDRAEQFLLDLGFEQLRVRIHGEKEFLARIEVPVDQIQRMASPEVQKKVNMRFHTLGFTYVTLDLAGYQTGSMNAGVK